MDESGCSTPRFPGDSTLNRCVHGGELLVNQSSAERFAEPVKPNTNSVVLHISEHLLDRRIDPDHFGDDGRLRRNATKANRVEF